MDDVLFELRTDLRNGLGLWDALQKHNITLQEAMDGMEKPIVHKVRKKKPPVFKRKYKHIYARCGFYIIQKTIKYQTVSFGMYHTAEDALKVRNYFMRTGDWNPKLLDEVCEKVGVRRRRKCKAE